MMLLALSDCSASLAIINDHFNGPGISIGQLYESVCVPVSPDCNNSEENDF